MSFAVILRFYQLGSIPGSLNQDEAALGYNAYSLLKTGADEHGKFFPLSMQSFGDWKLPVYPIITIPFIAIFGLTELAVRLPSATAGVICVYLIYKITGILFKNRAISLLSAFFFAISPWSIYFSKAAYEVNVASTLFLGGFYFLLLYLNSKKSSSVNLIPAGILFGLTLFTYHSYILFTPLFLVGIAILFYKKFIADKFTITAFILTIVFFCASFISLHNNGANKISNLSIINNENVIYNRSDKLKTDNSTENTFFAKLIHNKYSAVTYQFVENYIGVFSPSFLFDKGGEKLQHNLGNFGNLYVIDAFLIIAGILAMFWYHEKSILFLLPWFLFSPIPSALTTDSPNSTRAFLMLPLLIIIIAYGAGKLISIFNKKKFYIFFICLFLIIYFTNFIIFIDAYFIHFNMQRMRYWRYGEKQIVDLADSHPKYDIIIRGPEDFHYIYLLFYKKYDPSKFRKEVEYYPVTKEGFLYVKKFNRYNFVNSIDYDHLKPDTVYIDNYNVLNFKKTINLPSGEPFYGYIINDIKSYP